MKSGSERLKDANDPVFLKNAGIDSELNKLLNTGNPTEPKSSNEVPSVGVSEDDASLAKKADAQSSKVGEEVIDPYMEMVAAFRVFIDTHPLVAPIKLRMMEEKPKNYLIYQGQQSVKWAWLFPDRSCLFERTSLLRIILNLETTHPLRMYFKNYLIRTGAENVQ